MMARGLSGKVWPVGVAKRREKGGNHHSTKEWRIIITPKRGVG